MYCTKCGKKNDVGFTYCAECGKPMVDNSPVTPAQPLVLPVTEESVLANDNNKANEPDVKPGILAYSSSALISIAMAVFCIAFFAIFTVRSTLNENAISGMFDDVDFAALRVGRILDLDGEAYYNNIALAEWIFDEMDDRIIARYSITRRSIENFFDRLPLGEFIEGILIRYAEGILHGNTNTNITTREILNFVERNEHIFYREIGYRLSPADYDEIERFLLDIDINNVSSLDTLLGEIDMSAPVFRWGLSWFALALLALIIIGLSIAIFFIYKKRVRPTLMCDGTVLTVSGLFFTVLSVGANWFVAGVVPVEVDRFLVDALLSGLQGIGMTIGAAATVVGVVMVVASVLMGVARKKKAI